MSACVRRRPLLEALSFPKLMGKFAYPTANDMPVYIPWVEALPLKYRTDPHVIEKRGFSLYLKKLAPGAKIIKPPGDCEWPSGWEGSELHGIYCSDPNLPEVLNWMLKSEQQAERGQISDGMKSIQAEVEGTTAIPTAASRTPAAAASSSAIS
jgi:hypothetical protein